MKLLKTPIKETLGRLFRVKRCLPSALGSSRLLRVRTQPPKLPPKLPPPLPPPPPPLVGIMERIEELELAGKPKSCKGICIRKSHYFYLDTNQLTKGL